MSDTASAEPAAPADPVDDATPGADSTNPMLSALLSSLDSGGKFDPMSLLMSQLGGGGANDPRLTVLTKLMSQRASPTIIENEEGEAAEEAKRRRAEIRRERARRIRALRVLAKRMYGELEVLRERNDAFAAAIGACPVCFGDDPLCEECAGNGQPGSVAPDPDAWRQYVAPAVQRVRSIQIERARRQGRYVDSTQAAAAGGSGGHNDIGRSFATEDGRQSP
jgi:hypothetical protein